MPQCIICLDDKPKTFQANSRCVHHVCGPCLTQYLLSHLKTPQIEYTMVRCPENACNQHYRLDRIHTRGIFEEHEINDWWKALLVHTCFDSKGTCPYPDCGALFELYDESGGYEEDSYGECYECERPICLICETPWHPDHVEMTEGAGSEQHLNGRPDDSHEKTRS
ncbi:hypothetical protein BX666DRAFT_1206767 [Dichotomocladium elegans]|nr:hypothetical protein BX666DRAFT_1206767 [Dichotomocladium elegans]